jgi:hypothetical protein
MEQGLANTPSCVRGESTLRTFSSTKQLKETKLIQVNRQGETTFHIPEHDP